MAFTLPALPYDFTALEPHIDAKTMEIHHGKHHQTYVNNLNAAIEKAPELASKSLDDLMRGVNKLPEAFARDSQQWRRTLESFHVLADHGAQGRGRAGWKCRQRDQERVWGLREVSRAVQRSWCRTIGSGWAWVINTGGKLSITSTPNQDIR